MDLQQDKLTKSEWESIEIPSSQEEKNIYNSLKEEINPSATLETYLWDCVFLGLRFYEYDIEKILREDSK